VNRRRFLRTSAATGLAAGLGTGFWERLLAAPARPGPSPYGPLLAPDGNGLRLPAGFTSRVVVTSLALVPGTDHLWHVFPDGGACVPTDDGGWIYVSNSEFPIPVDVPDATAILAALSMNLLAAPGTPALPPGGGVGALRFDADGNVVDAYSILSGSTSNCAGGLTPWGTWLSCEEWESTGTVSGYSAGLVWECDPFGVRPAVARPDLGRFKHEMAACDPVRQQIYLTEDQPDGLLYRYVPPPGTWGTGDALAGGTLEAMRVDAAGGTSWIRVADHAAPAEPSGPLRALVPDAARFNGGEGCVYDEGRVYVTTKGDQRVWVHDIEAQAMAILYDRAEHAAPPLGGVDNLAVSAAHDLYVAEDGDNLEVCVITPDGVVAPVAQMVGGQHGFDSDTPIPLISEVTGLALSPDGNRLYLNSERGMGLGGAPVGPGPGILYEVTGPFRGGTLAAQQAAAAPAPVTAAPTVPTPPGSGRDVLPETGADAALAAATVAGAAGAALLHLRRRAHGSS
jgi:hypothetical protein